MKIYHGEHLNPASRYLRQYMHDVASQNGEDGIIERIFHIIGVENRFCVDVGAHDGKTHSNTWNLITNKGWSGELFEARDEVYQKLASRYSMMNRVHTYHQLVTDLDAVLQVAPYAFDFLSIDVDNDDHYLWASLQEYQPRAVCVEFNPTISNQIEYVPERGVEHGCSLRALINLGIRKNYELISTTAINAFFVRADLYDHFGIGDNSIHAMHNDLEFGALWWQRYDGVPVLVGRTKAVWDEGGNDIEQETVQILSDSLL